MEETAVWEVSPIQLGHTFSCCVLPGLQVPSMAHKGMYAFLLVENLNIIAKVAINKIKKKK